MSEEHDKTQDALNRLYRAAVSAAAARDEQALKENAGPTSEEIVRQLREKLVPVFGHLLLKIKVGARLGNQDSVYVTYASVPPNAGEVDALNARSNPMFSITAGKGHRWYADQPSPAKVTVENFRGSMDADRNHKSRLKFRAKTDSPEKIVKYLVDFFMKHKTTLLQTERER